MSTGLIVFTIIIAIASVVALGVMFAARIRASHTAQRNTLGQASNSERAQASRAFSASVVGLIVIFLALLGMPLVMKLADGMVADPAEETPTSTAVDAH